MVVIIDDRGDVWQWENNLIKVVPYDFFVGIGDINSSFLPKKSCQLTGPTKKRKNIAQLEALEEGIVATDDDDPETEKPDPDSSEKLGPDDITLGPDRPAHDQASPVDRILALGGGEDNANLLMEQSLTRNHNLEQQQHDRPLAKLQHNLDKMIHDHESESRHSSPESSDKDDDDDDEDDNLLFDDDNELVALNKALNKIHSEYYKYYQQYQQNQLASRPDLSNIIPQLKSRCLEGITILFSGILQLGINIDNADIVIWCRQFGVKVVNEVYKDEVTHVVCRDPYANAFKTGLTLKVRVAKKVIPGVKIVNPDWLFACLSAWSKVDETPYLIKCNDNDWHIEDADVAKYQKAVEAHKAREAARQFSRPRFDSVGSLEEYDLDDANQEVDDFLAGISDDDDEEAVEDDDNDDEQDEDAEDTQPTTNGTDSFIRDAYKTKRKRPDEDEDEEEEAGEKRQKIDQEKKKEKEEEEEEEEVDLDELEQELLDGFEDLDE